MSYISDMRFQSFTFEMNNFDISSGKLKARKEKTLLMRRMEKKRKPNVAVKLACPSSLNSLIIGTSFAKKTLTFINFYGDPHVHTEFKFTTPNSL